MTTLVLPEQTGPGPAGTSQHAGDAFVPWWETGRAQTSPTVRKAEMQKEIICLQNILLKLIS